MRDTVPPLRGILEIGLYVEDLDRAEAFYRDVFGCQLLFGDARVRALAVGGRHVLLLFVHGGSLQDVETPGGVLPGHDGRGQSHYAFAIDADRLDMWERHLIACGVEIESRMRWERGGHSLYFRDPDGHLGELVTPGCWAIH